MAKWLSSGTGKEGRPMSVTRRATTGSRSARMRAAAGGLTLRVLGATPTSCPQSLPGTLAPPGAARPSSQRSVLMASVIAFDVNETLLDLRALDVPFEAL